MYPSKLPGGNDGAKLFFSSISTSKRKEGEEERPIGILWPFSGSLCIKIYKRTNVIDYIFDKLY